MAISDYYISCTRKRPTSTLNDNKRYVYSYIDTDINGKLGRSRVQQIKVADKITSLITYNFYCDDLNILTGDIIFYESRNYEVLSAKNTYNNHHMKCILQLIENVK